MCMRMRMDIIAESSLSPWQNLINENEFRHLTLEQRTSSSDIYDDIPK